MMIMGHTDFFTYAVRGLFSRQLRSYLTILGVVIGIAAIVAIVSIGQGLSQYIQKELMAFGGDYLTINPGRLEEYASSGPALTMPATLTENDRKAIESVGGVEKAYGQITDTGSIEYYGEQGAGLVIGNSVGIWDAFPGAYKLREGRFYRAEAGELMLGAGVADNVFTKKVRVGDTMRINNMSFKVVGILEKGTGLMSALDYMVFVDVPDMMRSMGRARAVVSYEEIDVKLVPGSNADEVGLAVEEKLRNLHHVSEENQDFTLLTPSRINNLIGSITGTLNLFLGGLAGIALVVGGVGIANTMFMSVMERTREIGTLKALGARDRNIMEIFLIESGLIGLIGGLVGCAIGFALSLIMGQFGVPSYVDLPLVGYALLFSFAVGAISGFLPARQAARLPPVEALRYE